MLPSRTHVLERSPLFYARVAGSIYLAAMALSMFTQVYVPLDRFANRLVLT